MRTLLAAALLLTTLAAPAFADPTATPDVTKMTTDDCARARKQNKTCVLTIDDEKIDGSVPKSGETSISIATFIQHESLIRIRRDFIAEILKTAEDL